MVLPMFVFKKKEKTGERPSPQIIDFRKNVVRLPNGEVVSKDSILHIDTQRKIIVYIGADRQIKEVSYG